MSSVICRSVAWSLLAIRGVAIRHLQCKYPVVHLRVPPRGGSVPVLRMVRILIRGAVFVFVVVLVPVIPVVPVAVVRPQVGPLLRAQWGFAPRCMLRRHRHRLRIRVSHCPVCHPFRYCLHPVVASSGNTFLGRRHTILVYPRVHNFAKFSLCASAAICTHYVVPCQ